MTETAFFILRCTMQAQQPSDVWCLAKCFLIASLVKDPLLKGFASSFSFSLWHSLKSIFWGSSPYGLSSPEILLWKQVSALLETSLSALQVRDCTVGRSCFLELADWSRLLQLMAPQAEKCIDHWKDNTCHHPSWQSRRGQGTSEFITAIDAKHACQHGSVRCTSCGHIPCISISVVVCSVLSNVACSVLYNR